MVEQRSVRAKRLCGRGDAEMRPVLLERAWSKHAEGSCLVRCGETHVACTASFESRPPIWMRGRGRGWVSAQYGMLPRATGDRSRREASAGGQTGRSMEIQRLIGRSLRAVIDAKALGECQIIIDCDVLQADGGTRTAAITGGWVALAECIRWMHRKNMLKADPAIEPVAAISCGLVNGDVRLDLDYVEDSAAWADGNFVIAASGKIVEIQCTAENGPFSPEAFDDMLTLARQGIVALIDIQRHALA